MQMGLPTNPASLLTQQASSHWDSLLSAWVILEPEKTGPDFWGRHTLMKIILVSPLIFPPIWNFKESWAGWWYFRLGGCHLQIALQEHDPEFFWFACTNQLDSLSDKEQSCYLGVYLHVKAKAVFVPDVSFWLSDSSARLDQGVALLERLRRELLKHSVGRLHGSSVWTEWHLQMWKV